jgi:hypothetical protein
VKGNEAGILVTLHHVIPSDSEESLGTRHKGFLACARNDMEVQGNEAGIKQ